MNSSVNKTTKFRNILLDVMLLLVFMPGTAWAATTEYVRTVTVGYYPAPGLMNESEEGGTKSGYAYDYIQEIANRAGWRYKYVYGSFGELYTKLKNGEIDILPYVTRTEARENEVLFPKVQMGEERLYIGSMKAELLSDDLSGLKGKKVGIIKGAFYNGPFSELLKRKGVTCDIVEFSLAEERTVALEKGAVDYIVELSTAYQRVNLRAVYELQEKYPFYLAVTVGRRDLLEELIKVQEAMDSENPGLLNLLNLKYFKGIPLFKAIPSEGIAWLNSHKVIRIGAYDHDEPYVIVNGDGTASGIAPDYVAFMLKALNITTPVEWKIYDGRKSALTALHAGEVDLINPYYCSYGDAEKENVVISSVAFNVNFSVLYLGSYSNETMSVIATPSTRLGAMYVRDFYPKAQVIPCVNGFDCINKMLAGEANCVVMHTDALIEIASKYSQDFHIKPLNAGCPVCFAALPENVGLLTTIDKGIPFLTDVELNTILDKYNIEDGSKITARQFFRRHPEYLLLGFIVLLLAAVSVIILKIRANKRQKESLTFANYFIGTFVSTYYIDLKTHVYKVYKRSEELDRAFPVIPDYLKSIGEYINKCVHPDDREMLRNFIQPENLISLLREKPMDSVVYRDEISDAERIFRLWVVRGGDENTAAFAFANVTAEVKEEERRRHEQIEFAKVKMEQRKNDMLHDIVHSGKWSFFLNAENEIVDAQYSDVVEKVIGNELPDGEAYAWIDIVHPEDREEAVSAFQAAIADPTCKTPYDVTYRMKDKTGTYHWFHSAGRIIRQPDGTGEFFGIHINITEQIEAQLKQQRQLEAALTDAKNTNKRLDESNRHEKLKGDAFSFMQRNDNLEEFVAFFSERILKLYECDQVIYRDIEGRQILKERPGIKPLDFSLCANCRHFDFDSPVYAGGFSAMNDCKVGYGGIPVHPECRVRASLTYLVYEDGKVYGYIALHYLDHTHLFSEEEKNTFDRVAKFMSMVLSRRKQQDALKKSLAFSNYFINTFMSTYYVNLETHACIPYSRKEANAQEYPVIPDYMDKLTAIIEKDVHPEDRKGYLEFIQPANLKALLKEKPMVYFRARDISGENEKIIDLRVVRGADENYAAFAFADITEETHKEQKQKQQLEEALELAKSANKAKTEFLFNMSHDIRTPMNAILGFTGMAEKHLNDPHKVMDCLVKIQQSGNLLLTLINSILDMSRIEAGNAELQEKPGNVYYSFSNIETALQEIAATRDVKLTFEFGEVTDKYVYADFQRCIRIFTNLIANAIKYSHAGGYVKVYCSQVSPVQDGYASYRYTIEDNGIGMSEEFQKHMFETFAREHNSTISGIQGTGLGLSVCKTFIDYMNGSIDCVSKLGEGTTFTVTLPFRVQTGRQYTDPVTGEVMTEATTEEPVRDVDFCGKKVLLVEDNELNREIALEILEDAGFVVDEAEDGSIAVKKLEEKGSSYYDFILMDIQMPVMNGFEATKAIRRMYPEAGIPIIAVSANAFEEDRKASREAGMDDHVAKPVKIKELFDALARFL